MHLRLTPAFAADPEDDIGVDAAAGAAGARRDRPVHISRSLRAEPLRALAGLIVAVLATAGCAGSPPPATAASPGGAPLAWDADSTATSPTVGLKPGDAVRVSIWQEPDLTGEFLVNRAGRVVFPLLGEREVAGISPEEVEAQLTAEYRTYLENPSVEVTVLRRIAILGEVRNPSLYMVDPTVSLTQALALAGGLTPTGNRNDIRLVRNGEVLVQSLDPNRAVGAMPIESGDEIHVGQRSWASRNFNVILGTVTSLTVATLYILYRW
jgi:hypothetical protein